jgi:hypothetical protein
LSARSTHRQFQAARPNALWVSDFTYVATWSGFVYVAFVIDRTPGASSAGGSRVRLMPTSCWTCWSVDGSWQFKDLSPVGALFSPPPPDAGT